MYNNIKQRQRYKGHEMRVFECKDVGLITVLPHLISQSLAFVKVVMYLSKLLPVLVKVVPQ